MAARFAIVYEIDGAEVRISPPVEHAADGRVKAPDWSKWAAMAMCTLQCMGSLQGRGKPVTGSGPQPAGGQHAAAGEGAPEFNQEFTTEGDPNPEDDEPAPSQTRPATSSQTRPSQSNPSRKRT